MSVMVSVFDAYRSRTSEKYTAYPPDVLPMFVAEMDSMLAEPIRDALVTAGTRASRIGSAGMLSISATQMGSTCGG